MTNRCVLSKMSISIIILFSLFWHPCASHQNKTETINDRCSNFHGHLPNTSLVECSPAKFMIEDDYECYDKSYKDSHISYDNYFWCWSREDNTEDFLRNELNIKTSYRNEKYNTSFTASFQFNKTHIKCDNDKEDWAQIWYDVTVYLDFYIPCVTNIVPIVVNFQWANRYLL